MAVRLLDVEAVRLAVESGGGMTLEMRRMMQQLLAAVKELQRQAADYEARISALEP